MKKFRNGLIVGKFAPLHKGHEFVINRALEQCRQVFIFSYSNPEFSGFEPYKRRKWLETLFPQTKVFVFDDNFIKTHFNFDLPKNDEDDLTHRRFVGFLWLELVGQPLDAVFTSEEYGDGFAAELSNYFKTYTDFQAVEHIQIDLRRKHIPVSATDLRGNIHGLKHFLSPEVYASFVKRVCFLGGESSGKSTLAETLARKFKTEFVSEYGRTLWEERKGNLAFGDLLKIAGTHIRQEEIAAQKANEFLFIDTTPLTTLFYSRHLFGKADPELLWLSNRQYDFTFLCAPDFPFVQDGTRAEEDFRHRQHEWYLKTIAEKNIEFKLLEGDLKKRQKSVADILSRNSLQQRPAF
jgi:HTH-type transcriptional regulator, transcriptional repressor of NAD biosynthesis genes